MQLYMQELLMKNVYILCNVQCAKEEQQHDDQQGGGAVKTKYEMCSKLFALFELFALKCAATICTLQNTLCNAVCHNMQCELLDNVQCAINNVESSSTMTSDEG